MKSHPAGVRGLKLPLPVKLNDRLSVAPRRGAWIETGRTYETAKKVWVAPRRGAWIETGWDWARH